MLKQVQMFCLRFVLFISDNLFESWGIESS